MQWAKQRPSILSHGLTGLTEDRSSTTVLGDVSFSVGALVF